MSTFNLQYMAPTLASIPSHTSNSDLVPDIIKPAILSTLDVLLKGHVESETFVAISGTLPDEGHHTPELHIVLRPLKSA